ncbi:Homeodomain-containing transcription factor [Pyrenophora tritici-repentis]|nr:Homeodomain-containing transcription factor [Pyrenophora tritici-repentis]KAI1532326.1 Homeodomain-containing transcription factor [Pyrenophora tritici-repentis]KAI1535077.1 Homeodomain-containing transcription factor [Pyrenophora tritici-repentis]KAI1567184.1 Homeodomain-containing transcription factor [Pyrenophora tritici-repentis]KAI1573143.1 Homeodomain-containing transcription factor [Pyrenophora tritici-repentis]
MAASSPLPASLPFSSPASSRFRRASFSQLAFLVHSQESVANHMPPDVDNKALARQKRRRTSKEDEDILKSYYLKNPKPDKTARLEIVTKVALGEKEVQ